VVETQPVDGFKASNFERYVFGWARRRSASSGALDAEGEFARAGRRVRSGRSTHADRIATIRSVYSQYGVVIDPHTADGVKVGLEHSRPGETLICLETAAPAKFSATIREALGREPERPAGFENLEALPQRFTVVERDVAALKRFIESHG
jgi:threonine synthase